MKDISVIKITVFSSLENYITLKSKGMSPISVVIFSRIRRILDLAGYLSEAVNLRSLLYMLFLKIICNREKDG